MARLPRIPTEDGWEHGVNPLELLSMLEYWYEGFDWTEREAALNQLQHYVARSGASRLHFIKQSEEDRAAIPIVLVHGWPSSFLEMAQVVPELGRIAVGHSVDIVIPTLPGFLFSSYPDRPPRGFKEYGRILDSLVTELLGYKRYICHGSDWGAAVATAMAMTPDSGVVGLHLTGALASQDGLNSRNLSTAERAYLRKRGSWQDEEGAYSHQWRTKPVTASIGAEDSPAGLLAWILEKWHAWSGAGLDVQDRVVRDHILDVATLYWFTRSFTTSTLIYKDSFPDLVLPAGTFIDVPTSFASFSEDIMVPPREWVERTYRIVRFSKFQIGGHFPAYEDPSTLADDLWSFVEEVW